MLKMYTTHWCPDCRRAKRLLAESQVPFEEIDIENDPGAEAWVIERNQGKRRVPTFDLNGRSFACSPFDPQLLRRELGLGQ